MMKLEVGKVYRAKPSLRGWPGLLGYGGGYLWVCEKANDGAEPYLLKSIATGQRFRVTLPEIWLLEDGDENR
jgi:hypothetical protein